MGASGLGSGVGGGCAGRGGLWSAEWTVRRPDEMAGRAAGCRWQPMMLDDTPYDIRAARGGKIPWVA